MDRRRQLKTRIIRPILMLLLVLGPWIQNPTLAATDAADAEKTTPANGSSFEAFRILTDRNIFDSGRGLREPETTGPVAPTTSTTRIERILLIGALINRADDFNETVAFFEGASAGQNATVRPGGSIAGYRVVRIRTDGVTLEKAGQSFDLRMGSGLTRQNDGEWQVAVESGIGNALPRYEMAGGSRADQKPTARVAAGLSESQSGARSERDVLATLKDRRQQEAAQ